MQIVDTIVSRESDNSAWANVVFLGESGESISVRLPCTVPTGGPLGRGRIIKRAAALVRGLVDCEAFDRLGESVWSAPTGGRFGVSADRPVVPQEPWRNGSASGED